MRGRGKDCSEEATLRASVLAFGEDNDSMLSFHLHHEEIKIDPTIYPFLYIQFDKDFHLSEAS